jgi:muramoyltetrapeptide carboxypeptidase
MRYTLRMLIDIISPAGVTTDWVRLDRACERLSSLGYQLNCRAPRQGWQRFGGDDDARLEMIHAAARGPADAVMLTRGGYGLSRLLDRIDWALIAQAIARGQRWIGFSDFTIFQSALFAKTGATSFSGPLLIDDFGGDELNDLMRMSFQALLRGAVPVVQWDADGVREGPLACLQSQSVQGGLWGGNLTMVGNLVGTEYFPDRANLTLLWLEDVAEHPYRVERLLHQLFYADVLRRQRAVVFGSFNQWKPAPHDDGYGWDAMLDYFELKLRMAYGHEAPMLIEGLPFGHQPVKTVLEYGRPYRLSADRSLMTLQPLFSHEMASHLSTRT